MMHEKTDHACHYEIYHRTEQTYKRLKNCKLVIVSSANYYTSLVLLFNRHDRHIPGGQSH